MVGAMSTILLTLILIGIIFLVLRLALKDELKKIRLVGGEYGLNRRLKELLFERTPYAVVSIDVNGKVLMCNEKFHKKFGWKESEMIGENITKIMPERYRAMHNLGLQHYKDTGEKKIVNNEDGIEIYALHKNGTEFPVHLKLIEIEDNGFKTIGGFLRNITKDKEKERIWLNEITLLRQGESCAEIGTWSWDLLTREVKVTENFYKIFNVDKDEIVTSDMLMNYVYHEDRHNTALIINQAIEAKEDYRARYRRLQQDGSLQWIEVRGCLIFNTDNEIIFIIGTIQNVSDGLGTN